MTCSADRAFPPSGRLMRIAGRQIHAHVEGTGPDIVLIHGASGNVRDFTWDLVGRLTPSFRVTAFDRPGLGHSERLHKAGESPAEQAGALDAAAATLGIRHAVLVGHSFGAAVALAWALEHPDRVAAIVVLGGATMPWPGELGPWYRIAATGLGGAIVVPLVANLVPPKATKRFIQKVFAPQTVPDGYAEHVGVDLILRTQSLRANARQVGSLKPHLAAMARRYPKLDIPVEVVHGDADTLVPPAIHARPLAALLPNATLTELAGVGHMPHHADPAATVGAVQRAISRAGLH